MREKSSLCANNAFAKRSLSRRDGRYARGAMLAAPVTDPAARLTHR